MNKEALQRLIDLRNATAQRATKASEKAVAKADELAEIVKQFEDLESSIADGKARFDTAIATLDKLLSEEGYVAAANDFLGALSHSTAAARDKMADLVSIGVARTVRDQLVDAMRRRWIVPREAALERFIAEHESALGATA